MDVQGVPTAPIRVVAPGKEWGVEPVELMVQKGVQKVPSMFRRLSVEEEQQLKLLPPSDPTEEGSDLDIPLIDLKDWDESQREDLVRQVREACEEWGFFRIVNHGVDTDLMRRMMQAAKEFFALPVEEKAAYVGKPGMISQGYGSKYIIGAEEAVRDWRDYLYLWLLPERVRDYASWPSKPEAFRETMEAYSKAARELATKLLGLMSEGLGARRELLEEALGELYQKTLLNFYPACPEPQVVDGFHQHSDIGALTVVLQEEEAPVGLQVRHGDCWVPARSVPTSFVINVADQVEILTNGRYKSIEHRVVPSLHRSRLSIPVFYDAPPEAMIAPLKEIAAAAPAYKQINFDDHEHAFYEHGANGKAVIQSYKIPTPPQGQPLTVA